jgi:type I restriction enzyme R subunit
MAYTDINSEDRLVQKTFAEHLQKALGWESVYAWNTEVFGTLLPSPHPSPNGRGSEGEGVCDLGRADTREVVLTRELRAALVRLNPQLPPAAITDGRAKNNVA